MRRGIYDLLTWVAAILGLLEVGAAVLFALGALLLVLFPTLPVLSYPQAFVLALLTLLALVVRRPTRRPDGGRRV